MYGVVHGAGRFVAVGEGGLAVTSVDGATWVTAKTPTRQALHAVTYADGRFLAVGAGGTMLVSTDGSSWAVRQSGVTFDLNAVAYGGGRFVAAGNMGTLLTSADAATWTRQPVGTVADLRSAAYGGGRMAVVGDSGTILTATDGGAFDLKGARAEHLYGIAHGNGRSVAMGLQISVSIIDAPWTVYRTLPLSGDDYMRSVAFGGGQFVGVGAHGMIYRSTDGIDWTAAAPSAVPQAVGLAFGGSQFVAVGPAGIMSSADGASWAQRQSDSMSAVAYGNGFFVAMGDAVYTSADGVAWTLRSNAGGSPDALLFGNGRFVAVGPHVTVSVDGANWVPATAGPGERLMAGAAGNGRFAAIGASGTIFTSGDGHTWQRGFNPGSDLAGISFGNGRFMLVSHSGSVYTSTDGMIWAMRPRLAAEVDRLAFVGAQFIATAEKGVMYTSADGEAWVRRSSGAPGAFRAIAQGAGRMVALGEAGSIFRLTGEMMAPCGGRFGDVAELYPACEAVERLAGRGVLGGYPDGTFRPEAPVTRAEFAKMIVIAMGWQPQPGAALPFSDVAGHWAAGQGYLQTAYQMGVINGFPDGTFQPDGPLTRSQAVKIVAAAAALGQQGVTGYADVPAGAWYAGYLGGAQQRQVVGAGAVSPLWDGPVFREGTLVIRAEAAMLLGNLR
jgi:hypothetical protein